MHRLVPMALDTTEVASFFDTTYWVEQIGSQFVRAVMIASVDGAAAVSGRSGGLGNAADSTLFGVLRAQADVLLVGAGTARAEHYAGDRPTDLQRAVRRAHGLADAPRMAVVTRGLSLAPDSPVFTDTATRPLVVTCRAAPSAWLEALRPLADIVIAGDETVDLAAALDELADRGLHRVNCEGGPSLLAGVAAIDRLDELALTVAPTLRSGSAVRILSGESLDPPVGLRVHDALLDSDYLYLRYRRAA